MDVRNTERVLLRPAQIIAAGYFDDPTSLWRAWKAGQFPKPLQLSERRVAFVKSEVDGWLASRPRAGDGPLMPGHEVSQGDEGAEGPSGHDLVTER